ATLNFDNHGVDHGDCERRVVIYGSSLDNMAPEGCMIVGYHGKWQGVVGRDR
ncbi:hypothetical protein Ancab_014717, partial [Ancistrocladus abbreviatus]